MSAVMALAGVLREVVEDQSQEKGAATSTTGESGAVTTGGCGCGGSSIESRVAVARRIVEYLHVEARPGEVGRPEMDAYAALVRRLGIPTGAWEDFIDALAWRAQTRRVATWKSLSLRLESLARPGIAVGARLAGEDPKVVRIIARPLGHGVGLARALLGVSRNFAGGRCLIPLEDLMRFGLTDRRLAALMAGSSAGADAEAGSALEGLWRFEVNRAEALLEETAQSARVLPRRWSASVRLYAALWREALRRASPTAAAGPDAPDPGRWAMQGRWRALAKVLRGH